jgi:mannose-6-phosphate isomerase-like protein (cupin superfamily)
MKWLTTMVKPEYDKISTGGAQVFLLIDLPKLGNVSRMIVENGVVSRGGRLNGLDDAFFIVNGTGELWLSEGPGRREETVKLEPGVTAVIPAGASYQYRAFGGDLEFLEVVVPEWEQLRRLEPDHKRWQHTNGPERCQSPLEDGSHDPGRGDDTTPSAERQATWDTSRVLDVEPVARDGFAARRLSNRYSGATLEHLVLSQAQASAARVSSTHEVWVVLEGSGDFWRSDGRSVEEHVSLAKFVAFDMPPGTAFQLRASKRSPLKIFAVSIDVNGAMSDLSVTPRAPW